MEWLFQGHLAYFMLDVVEQLNLGEIESVGEFSSRRIARATYEDVAFRMISGGQHPHFTTINQFRLDHGEALGRLFVEVLRLCRAAGLVKLGSVALDGTKIKAAASKHKAMSYKRTNEEEARLEAQVKELLRRAAQTDREEDELYGPGQDKQDLPVELSRRETRLQRLRAAKAELEAQSRRGASGRAARASRAATRQGR